MGDNNTNFRNVTEERLVRSCEAATKTTALNFQRSKYLQSKLELQEAIQNINNTLQIEANKGNKNAAFIAKHMPEGGKK